jgi:hypothetical protein
MEKYYAVHADYSDLIVLGKFSDFDDAYDYMQYKLRNMDDDISECYNIITESMIKDLIRNFINVI